MDTIALERDIDLRKYVDSVIRRRRLIITLVLLSMLAGGIAGIISPAPYQANVRVAMIKEKTDVAFDSRLETLSEDELASESGAKLDIEARRQSLASLVRNPAIADAVIERLGDQLGAVQPGTGAMLAKVEAQVVPDSDLIGITVTDQDPARAAAIANAWGVEYENYINNLYSGAPLGLSNEVGTELQRATVERNKAQAAVEAFLLDNQIDELAQQIAEKRAVIELLQKGKSTAVSTIIDEQIKAQQQIINAYYSAQSSNKLLAFNKQQEAKRQMLAAYIDSEIESRLAAFRRDRAVRMQAFNAAVEAEQRGQAAVINEQISEKMSTFARYYAQKTSIARLLDNAQAMRAQLEQGGNAAAASNGLALLLLKAQAFTPTEGIPANLQLQVDSTTTASAAEQIVDVDAVITALEEQLEGVEANIQTASRELMAGTGYDFLNDRSLTPLTLSSTPGVTATGTLSTTTAVSGTLAEAINQRYRELFEVGPMATQAENIASDTPLFAEIKKLYPDLFTVDQLMELGESIPVDNPLAMAASQRSKDLLQLKELEDLPNFSVSTEPLVEAVRKLQQEVRELEVQQEREQARRNELEQNRTLANEVYGTLLRKQTELGVASAVTGSEVRVASPAFAPGRRSASSVMVVVIAGILGLLLGIVAALLVDALVPNTAPGRLWGDPSRPWNRVYRWVMTPRGGLPPRGTQANRGDSAMMDGPAVG